MKLTLGCIKTFFSSWILFLNFFSDFFIENLCKWVHLESSWMAFYYQHCVPIVAAPSAVFYSFNLSDMNSDAIRSFVGWWLDPFSQTACHSISLHGPTNRADALGNMSCLNVIRGSFGHKEKCSQQNKW